MYNVGVGGQFVIKQLQQVGEYSCIKNNPRVLQIPIRMSATETTTTLIQTLDLIDILTLLSRVCIVCALTKCVVVFK